jgi:hypothetical protein
MATKARRTKTLKPTKKGQKKITFHPGGLHSTLGVKPGKKIPAGKMQQALQGKLGPKAKKQALFKKNVLTGRKGK